MAAMAQHYPSLDLDPPIFPHPPSPPAPTPPFLPAYLPDPPPSYYNPPPPPPSYSAPTCPPRSHDLKSSSQFIASFPDSGISFPPANPPSAVQHPARDTSRSASRITIAHPYARLYAKKDGSKRRKIWNHVLEKQLFSPQELSVPYLSPVPKLNPPVPDPPWVHPTGAQYTLPPSKPTSTVSIISCSALACIRSPLNASNPTVASTQRQQRYLVSHSPLSFVADRLS